MQCLSDIGYQITMACKHPPYRTPLEETLYYRFTSMGKWKYSKNCRIREEVFYSDDPDLKGPAMIFWSTIRDKEGKDCGPISPEATLP